jgi:hypothetical protein
VDIPPPDEVDIPPSEEVDIPPPDDVDNPPPEDVLKLRGHVIKPGMTGLDMELSLSPEREQR